MSQADDQEREGVDDGTEQVTEEQFDMATEEMVEIIFEKWEGERGGSKAVSHQQ